MRFIVITFFLVSCSFFNSDISERNYAGTLWKILENASIQSLNKKDIIKSLGNPKEKYIHKDKLETWFYFQKNSGLQEWAVTFNMDDIESMLYIPKDQCRHEFTIEKIAARWKNLNCAHKTKQELRPGLVKVITYLDCDKGHRIITYNRYKEVESILIDY